MWVSRRYANTNRILYLSYLQEMKVKYFVLIYGSVSQGLLTTTNHDSLIG